MLGCGISLSNVLLHMTAGVLVPCWTLYYKAVSGPTDDLKGVWVECSAEFVSLVLLDKNFITQFNAGGTGPAVYVCISFTLSFLFSIVIMYFIVISMVDAYRIYSINRPGRLLNFWTLRVGAYSRWALIRGWALIKFSAFSASVVCLFCNKSINGNDKTRRCNKARFL